MKGSRGEGRGERREGKGEIRGGKLSQNVEERIERLSAVSFGVKE